MLIAGIQPTTLVDYPDKVATLVFTPGCNLRCRFCHNPELVLPEALRNTQLIPEEHFSTFLYHRKWLLDGVVISGGEPTLQSDLFAFCVAIKKLGYCIKLDTNGRDPNLVRQLIDAQLVDYIAMDVKIDFAQRFRLLQTKEKSHPYLETIALLLEARIPYEFRTTLIKPYHTADSITSILSLIRWAQCYALQTFRPIITLDPTFLWHAFTRAEMLQWKKYALQFVQSCEVR